MLCLNLQQFANSRTSSSHKPYYEVPFCVTILLQFPFQELVVSITDDVFQKILLLHLDKSHFQFVLLAELQELVDTLQTKIDSLRFEMLYQIALVG